MEDKLDQFMRENRSEFDDPEPQAGHAFRMEERLKQMDTPTRSLMPRRWWVAAAVVAALLVWQTYSDQNVEDPPEKTYAGMSLSDVSPELGEVEQFYTNRLDRASASWDNLSTEEQELYTPLLMQLEALDQDFKDLKIELEKNSGDQRVINSMIQNYRIRLELIDRHLELIELINDNKINNHENQPI